MRADDDGQDAGPTVPDGEPRQTEMWQLLVGIYLASALLAAFVLFFFGSG